MFMAVTPNTDLYLLQCPIELDNRNQINFSTADAQFNYFYNLPKLEAENFTYQRKDSIIRFPAHIDSLLSYTYVMYRNTNYGSKWFYAYITDMQYINDNMTAITISTDVWQTWCFNLSIKKSFVEREHVENDAFGLHTIPENIEYGEYVTNSNSSFDISTTISNTYIAVQVTELTPKAYAVIGSRQRVYGGLPQGCWIILLDPADYNNINNFVRCYDNNNLAEAIVSMSLIPKSLAGSSPIGLSIDEDTYPYDIWLMPASTSATTLGNYTWNRNTSINGYVPKNNKLFTSPYNYLMITNNGGMDITYRWEDFSSSNANFTVRAVPKQGCDIKLTPSNYKATDLNGGYEWSVTAQKLPCISWNSDYYLNWQAVNGANIKVQTTLSALNFAGGVIGSMLGLNTGGGVTSFASDVANTMQQIREAKMTPDSAQGNTNTGDINFSLGKVSFTGYKMSIKAEYARKIDEFFNAFGYQVNEFKNVQYTSRRSWNYIKTKGIAIEAQIPQGDLQSIKDIFNNGVTMWHNPSTFMDYSQSNNIV